MFKFLLIAYFVWRVINLGIALLAQHTIPYLGFFSYRDTMFKYNLPDLIRSFSNFDGIMYARIATQGYSMTEQAFFPLYPILIRIFNYFINNPVISGTLISLLAGITGIWIFTKYLPVITETKNIKWIALMLLAYPTSYYLGVMYTESLFFFLLSATLYSMNQKKYLLAAICGYLLALTRVQGVFALIPMAAMATASILARTQEWKKYMLIALGPALGLLSYMTYLWHTVGDPLYFLHAQESFGANRSSDLILLPQVIYRYFKIFVTATPNFQYFVAILEFIFLVFAITILIYDLYKTYKNDRISYERVGLNLFSWSNILAPSMTGTFTSIPRYTLMSLSIIVVVGEIQSAKIRTFLLIIFSIIQVVMIGLFTQGYFLT